MTYKLDAAYRQQQAQRILSLSPGQLTLALYDGVLGRIQQARIAFEMGRVADRGAAIAKALAILEELTSSLDKSQGDVAQNLDDLYYFATRELLYSNLRADPLGLDRAERVLKEVRDAWAQIVETQATPTAKIEPAARVAPEYL